MLIMTAHNFMVSLQLQTLEFCTPLMCALQRGTREESLPQALIRQYGQSAEGGVTLCSSGGLDTPQGGVTRVDTNVILGDAWQESGRWWFWVGIFNTLWSFISCRRRSHLSHLTRPKG